MPTATIGKNYSLPGVESLQVDISRVGEAVVAFGGSDAPITLNPAKACVSWVKIGADSGTCTLASGHGLTSGVFDFYWLDAGVEKCHYSSTVTILADAVTVTTGGIGDDLPVNGTTVAMCKQKVVSPALIDGDALSVFWAAVLFGNPAATGRGHVAAQETAGTAVGAFNVTGIQRGTAVAERDITGGSANPLTGNVIGKLQVTHNDLVYTPTFVFRGVLTDVSP